MTLQRNDRGYKLAIYGMFALIIFAIHASWGYRGDDSFLLTNISTYSVVDRLIYLYGSNGRICTDVAANILLRIPMVLWKIFDTAVWVAILALIVQMFTQNTVNNVLATAFLLLIFPFWYISTAGYICVSTNYIYTFFCLLLIALPFCRISKGKNVLLWQHVLSVLAMFYATNHDQTAVVLIAGLLFYLVFCILDKADKRLIRIAIVYLFISFAFYAFMFFMPGHQNRMSSTLEMETYLPEYAQWSFFKKMYRGYTSTVAHIMFDDVKLFCLFCGMLTLVAWTQDGIAGKVVGSVPSAIVTFVWLTGKENYIHYDYILPELYSLETGTAGFVGLVLSVVVLVSIFVTVCLTVKDRKNKLLILLLLVLAAGSREMMGFSATIYASSYRTFIFFVFALIISCLRLQNELDNRGQGLVAIAPILAVLID